MAKDPEIPSEDDETVDEPLKDETVFMPLEPSVEETKKQIAEIEESVQPQQLEEDKKMLDEVIKKMGIPEPKTDQEKEQARKWTEEGKKLVEEEARKKIEKLKKSLEK